jgi:hypothetical protein
VRGTRAFRAGIKAVSAEVMRLQVTLVNLAKEARSSQELLQLATTASTGISATQLAEVFRLTANLPGVRDGSLAPLLREAAKLCEAKDPEA